MIPLLRNGDKVIINKRTEIKRFDLIAFKLGNEKIQIRRVIGLPGETVFYKDDVLYINDQPQDEKFLVEEINESQKNGRNYTEDFTKKTAIIPQDYYFVMGDNRSYATDSRYYGLIAQKNIIGKVEVQLLPINEIKLFSY